MEQVEGAEKPAKPKKDGRVGPRGSYRTNQNPRPNKLNVHFDNAEELNAYVLSMIESGSVNQTEMAKLLGVSRQRVQQRLATINPNYGRGQGADPIAVLKAVRKAKNWNTVCASLNYSVPKVKELLHALGKLEAAERLMRMRKYRKRLVKKAKMISQLQEAAKVLGRTPTADDMNKRRAGLAPSASYQKYFKGVANAQKLAGLAFTRRGGRPKFPTPISKEELILELQRIKQEYGRVPSYELMLKEKPSKYPINRFVRTFGLWSTALKAAGFEVRTSSQHFTRRAITKEQAIENLKAGYLLKGSTPAVTDMNKKLYNLYSATVFQRLFGTVTAAQKAAGLELNFIDHRHD